MTEERWRTISMALGGLLAVLIALVAIFVALRPAGPAPTGSPTFAAVTPSPSASRSITASPSPSPSVPATATAEVSPSPSPSPVVTEPPTSSPSPSPEPSPSPSPTISPEPSPSPTLAPTAEQTVVRFPNIGLDSGLVEGALPRLVTFVTDGPGNIRAVISDVTAGEVQLCLWEGPPREQVDLECIDTDDGALSRRVSDAAQHTWTVSVESSDPQFAPTTALTLRFRAAEPAITIRDFRFQGSLFPEYNGVEVEVDAREGGLLAIDASWSGGTQPFRLAIEDAATDESVDEVTGEGEGVEHSVEVADASTYRFDLGNDSETVLVESLLRGRISWP